LLYIFQSDWLIRLEGGVKKLSDIEILEACEESTHFSQVSNYFQKLRGQGLLPVLV